MKILIAGLGSIGQRHLSNLWSLGMRDLLVYRARGLDVPQLEQWKIPVYRDLEEALGAKPDAVFVTNPTSLHLSVALPAARRGCHLFIEKPLSHDLQGVEELKRLVRVNRLVALVGCQLRFHPGLQRVRQLLSDGVIGKVIAARLHVGEYLPGWHPWEDYRQGYSARRDLGGGAILTLIHELDYAYWLFGEVAQVFACAGKWSDLELDDVEDTAEILLEFTNGVRASVHLNYIQQPPTRLLMVVGDRGTMTWNYHEPCLRYYSTASSTWQDIPVPQSLDRNDLFLEETRHFLRCIREGGEPLIPLKEAQRVLEIALATKQSAATTCLVPLRSPAFSSSHA